ncbi:MAG: hypothetical protein U5R46_11885 [Gammaproteobacteria bacterium]|nr:hypothetical protein [Gammaproteobacteria bacterium]
MKIRIADLPSDVSEDDIRGLLDNSEDIKSIEVVEEGDSDNPVAIVDLEGDAAAEGAVNLLNGRNWKNATLRAEKLLY